VEYARARHILVVPEIELPGHSTALLASHPEFSCLARKIRQSASSRKIAMVFSTTSFVEEIARSFLFE